MVEIRKSNGRHNDDIIEPMPALARHLCSETVTRHIIPAHVTPVKHTAQRKPMFEPPLVLNPNMLVMAVVLVVSLSVTLRHGRSDCCRVVPDEALEKLVSPSDAQLIMLREIGVFILCV